MTELTVENPPFRHSHDIEYWCPKGHWLLKALAVLKKGKVSCPFHRCWVRTNTRNATFKHEEKVTRY